MWGYFKRFGPDLYDRTTPPLSLKVRMLKAEALETDVRVCDVDPQRATLRQAPIGAPPSPPASHWLPEPTAYRPHYPFVRGGPQEDTMPEHQNDHA